jgi:hypothetical protein
MQDGLPVKFSRNLGIVFTYSACSSSVCLTSKNASYRALRTLSSDGADLGERLSSHQRNHVNKGEDEKIDQYILYFGFVKFTT